MFEYKNEFLLQVKTDAQCGQGDTTLCSASLAEDQMSALADLVGKGETLQSPSMAMDLRHAEAKLAGSVSEPAIQLVEDAPALEFDLEQELSQALEQQMMEADLHSIPQPAAPQPVMTESVAAASAAIDLENIEQSVRSEATAAPSAAFDRVLSRDTGPVEAIAPVLPELTLPELPMPELPVPELTVPELIVAPTAEPALELPEMDLDIDLDGELEAALNAELSMELEKALEEEALQTQTVAAPVAPVEENTDLSAAFASLHQVEPVAETPPPPPQPAPFANVFGGLASAPSAAAPNLPGADMAGQPPQPMDDFRRELSRLMGGSEPRAQSEPVPMAAPVQPAPVAAAPAPVAPTFVAEPVMAAAAPVAAPAAPVAPPVAQQPAPPVFETVAMPAYAPEPLPEYVPEPVSAPASAPAPALDPAALYDTVLASQPIDTPVAAAATDQPELAQPEIVQQDGAQQDMAINFDEEFAALDPVYEDPAAVYPAMAHEDVVEADNDNRRRKGMLAAAVVGAIALLGGAAAIGISSFGGADGPAPEILASSEPVKVKPESAGGQVVPNQDQAVFQSGDAAASQTSLNDSAEKPITVALNDGATKNEDRITTGDTTRANGLPVQSRRVRTVVVRPDGTIISNTADQPAASNSSVPVQAPTLSLQPTLEPAAPAAQPAAPRTITYNAPRADDGAAAPAPQQVAKVEAKPVKVETVKVKPAPAPVAPKPVAAKKPAAPATTGEGLPSVSSPFAVQVASQRSAAAAKKSYSTLSRRYASVIGGKGVDIRKAVITGKGTYYRVRIPAQSRSAANTLCGQLKARGGSCFVTR